MPQRAKGARLYLHPKRRIWIIRDGSASRSTGCAEADIGGAERALQEWIAEKHQPVGDHRPSAVAVADVLIYYGRQVAPGHKARATTGYAIDRLAEWWGDKLLADVRRSTCQAYAEHRTSQNRPQAKSEAARARKVSLETVRRELTVLRAAINAYHAEHVLDAVPVVTLPPASPPRERWLTRSEVARLLWACRSHPLKPAGQAMARFILLALYTGTRSGAIRSLSWLPSPRGGWIDVERGVLHRQAEGQRITNKRQPPLRIPRRLLGHLRRWQAIDALAGRPSPLYYAAHILKKQRRAWARVRADAGLGAEVVPHTLRHTAATWMMQAGTPAWETAGFLGMSPDVLWEIYGHHHPDFQTGIAERFGRRGTRL